MSPWPSRRPLLPLALGLVSDYVALPGTTLKTKGKVQY